MSPDGKSTSAASWTGVKGEKYKAKIQTCDCQGRMEARAPECGAGSKAAGGWLLVLPANLCDCDRTTQSLYFRGFPSHILSQKAV